MAAIATILARTRLDTRKMTKTNNRTREPKPLKIWMREISVWTGHGLKLVLPYIVLLVALYLTFNIDRLVIDCKELEIRLTGLILQALGFLIVVFLLTNVRKLFQKPPILSQIKSFVEGFPSRRPKMVRISAEISSGASSVSARLSVRPGTNAALIRRVELLERDVEKTIKNLVDLKEKLNSYDSENKRFIEAFRIEFEARERNLRNLLDEAVVGGIYWELVGVLYFLVGVVLTTVAPEIAVHLGQNPQCA